MAANQDITQLLWRLWGHIGRRRQKQLGWLVLLMILAAFAEVLSIGAVLPFLAVLVAPDSVFAHPAAQPFVHTLGLRSAGDLILPLTVFFCGAALLAGALRVVLLWINTRLSCATITDLSSDVYRRTLYQPYVVHIGRNSSEVVSGIVSKTSVVFTSILLPMFTLMSSGILLIAILVALLYVDPIIALITFFSFGLIYGATVGFTRRKLFANGERIAAEYTRTVKSLQEGLGGIRDILIDGSQAAFCDIYRDAALRLRRAQADNEFISSSPRYVLEALGIVFIAGLAFALTRQDDGVAKAIPLLGALALGAQRLLPVLQQGYWAITSIKGNQASLYDCLELLDQPMPQYAQETALAPMPFGASITVSGMSFRYSERGTWVFRDLSLDIPKGARVGFIGETGSGKSTLLDLVMGLLQPTGGIIAIDGETLDPANCRAWQAHIAHVPQSIFLADITIEENIAFGVPKDQIDRERVVQAAGKAQITDLIADLPDGYGTLVGERGVRLSGGQRQRIGIARALYKQADVIIFDEATSALDNETERGVMQSIERLDRGLTILIIAHRLTTLQGCTRIVELGNGGIIRSGTYPELIIKAD